MSDERFYEAMNIICDDIEEGRSDSSATDIEIAAAAAHSLIEEGLIATREEWSAAYIGVTPDGTRTIRLIGTEGSRSHAEAERDACSRDDPDTRFFLVRQRHTEWQEVTE